MRQVVLASIASSLLLASAQAARAQGQDGAFLLQACTATLQQADGVPLSPQDSAGAIYCAAYVSGFLDASSLATAADKSKKMICLPERGITNDQGVRLLVKYLQENPQVLHESGRMSLFVALAKTFPCKK